MAKSSEREAYTQSVNKIYLIGQGLTPSYIQILSFHLPNATKCIHVMSLLPYVAYLNKQ